MVVDTITIHCRFNLFFSKSIIYYHTFGKSGPGINVIKGGTCIRNSGFKIKILWFTNGI